MTVGYRAVGVCCYVQDRRVQAVQGGAGDPGVPPGGHLHHRDPRQVAAPHYTHQEEAYCGFVNDGHTKNDKLIS